MVLVWGMMAMACGLVLITNIGCAFGQSTRPRTSPDAPGRRGRCSGLKNGAASRGTCERLSARTSRALRGRFRLGLRFFLLLLLEQLLDLAQRVRDAIAGLALLTVALAHAGGAFVVSSIGQLSFHVERLS